MGKQYAGFGFALFVLLFSSAAEAWTVHESVDPMTDDLTICAVSPGATFVVCDVEVGDGRKIRARATLATFPHRPIRVRIDQQPAISLGELGHDTPQDLPEQMAAGAELLVEFYTWPRDAARVVTVSLEEFASAWAEVKRRREMSEKGAGG